MRGAAPASVPLTLYVHLPWCVRKCPYCDFNSHAVAGSIPEDAYVDALLADLDGALRRLDQRSFDTVYFGGGTPSLFAPASIARLLGHLDRAGRLASAAEITLEANPGAADSARFRGYRAAGVNRLSVGVQSFADASLAALGRIHDADDARSAAALATEHFGRCNLDLMYGLPGQTAALAVADVEQALAFGPTHLSCYQLTLEPNTVFAKYPPTLPDEAVQAAIEGAVLARLQRGGYEHYEVSAHALPGQACRHNRHYWEFADYLGIGAGAHSKLTLEDAVVREARTRVPADYLAGAPKGRHIARTRRLGRADLQIEFMMNALRLRRGFEVELLEARTGLTESSWRPPLDRAVRRGLVSLTGGRVVPTDLGRRYLNQLAAEFLTA